MNNKKEKTPEKIVLPPLSWIDHLIYIFMLACLGAGAIIICLNEELRNNIFFPKEKEILLDSNIVALRISDDSILLWLVLFIIFYISTIVLLIALYVCKNPLVGNPNAIYGAPEYTEAYPLFMKKSNANERAWKIVKKDRIQITAWICCLVLCGILARYMPYKYQCLYANGSVDIYRSSGEWIKHYSYREVEEVFIETVHTSGKYSKTHIQFRVRMNRGGSRTFTLEDFVKANGKSRSAALKEMIKMSDFYFEQKPVYEDTTYLSNVLKKYEFSDEERQLLFQLFTTTDSSDWE